MMEKQITLLFHIDDGLLTHVMPDTKTEDMKL